MRDISVLSTCRKGDWTRRPSKGHKAQIYCKDATMSRIGDSHGKHGRKKTWQLDRRRGEAAARREKQEDRHQIPRAREFPERTSRQRARHGCQRAERQKAARRAKRTSAMKEVFSHQCKKCQQRFNMTATEQAWYTSKGFQQPSKCHECRRGGSTKKERTAAKHKHTEVLGATAELGRLFGQLGANLKRIQQEHGVVVQVQCSGSAAPVLQVKGSSVESVMGAVRGCKIELGLNRASVPVQREPVVAVEAEDNFFAPLFESPVADAKSISS